MDDWIATAGFYGYKLPVARREYWDCEYTASCVRRRRSCHFLMDPIQANQTNQPTNHRRGNRNRYGQSCWRMKWSSRKQVDSIALLLPAGTKELKITFVLWSLCFPGPPWVWEECFSPIKKVRSFISSLKNEKTKFSISRRIQSKQSKASSAAAMMMTDGSRIYTLPPRFQWMDEWCHLHDQAKWNCTQIKNDLLTHSLSHSLVCVFGFELVGWSVLWLVGHQQQQYSFIISSLILILMVVIMVIRESSRPFISIRLAPTGRPSVRSVSLQKSILHWLTVCVVQAAIAYCHSVAQATLRDTRIFKARWEWIRPFWLVRSFVLSFGYNLPVHLTRAHTLGEDDEVTGYQRSLATQWVNKPNPKKARKSRHHHPST